MIYVHIMLVLNTYVDTCRTLDVLNCVGEIIEYCGIDCFEFDVICIIE